MILIAHQRHYFEEMGETLKDTNGEFTETCHSTLRISEERHGLKIVRKVGTPIHQYKGCKKNNQFGQNFIWLFRHEGIVQGRCPFHKL